jgi:SWI/SNF-related matrix-associated actin-dependent regulator 1 of chromatin subfamily A
VQKPSPTKTFVDLTGDEGLRQGGSSDSDDGGLSRGNIKPSTFLPKSGPSSFSGKPGINGNGRFSEFVNSFKAPTPHMGGRQTKPERARPVQDIGMDSLSDAQVRENVIRIRRVLPHITMLAAKNALVECRGSLEQAMELLGGEGTREEVIEIGSDDEIQMLPARDQPQMMRGLNAPTVSIRDKYSSTQALPQRKSSQVSTPQPKPKRKLMQGRRNPSSPAVPIASSPLKPQQSSPVASLHDDFDSDSGVASAEEEEDPGLASRLLKYLNTCKVEELIELTNTTKENAEAMINARPFHDLDIARTVENTGKTLKSGKKSKKAPIGDKIVDTAIDMFKGYEAIDTLCTKCEDLGRAPAEEMAKWGFDVFGASKSGELEMTSLEDDADSLRDSGIGSPSSGTASPKHNAEDDIRIVATKRKRGNVNFLKKPDLMAEDCVLKDYQVVGLNWLNLMYQKKLSCILADEMGLGKTCQVIAFISHLVSIGHTGPHLVVCPGSTLENWLRECNRFAPELMVEPYHGRYREHLK